jgi:hypothetical protein
MKLKNETYNVLKWATLIALPAAAYFGLSQIWGLPYGEQVVGTISVLTVFMGTLLGISTAKFNKDNK